MNTRSSDTTDLERRVLAHERVLQALIAYMARTEPRFIDHLRERFVEPMTMETREHDYRNSDDYAEEFIRAVMLLGELRAADGPEAEPPAEPPPPPEAVEEADGAPERVQVRMRNGVWEVKADGTFRGDYHKKEHAVAAAALLKLSLA